MNKRSILGENFTEICVCATAMIESPSDLSGEFKLVKIVPRYLERTISNVVGKFKHIVNKTTELHQRLASINKVSYFIRFSRISEPILINKNLLNWVPGCLRNILSSSGLSIFFISTLNLRKKNRVESLKISSIRESE